MKKATRGRALAVLLAPVALACRQEPASTEPRPAVPVRSRAWSAAVAERGFERAEMVSTQLESRDIRDGRVLAAMRTVPRHRFVGAESRRLAYEDSPLPIPGEQTISQPYIVAFMSQAADIQPHERCLEIGTGSGYQAAILAELCRETYSIEYLPEVARFGRNNLESLGYVPGSVELRVGDGYAGWPEKAPFDAILVTAAPDQVPRPLLRQLALAGRLVIPVGGSSAQNMEVWTRQKPGDAPEGFARQTLFGVRFVPFLGPQGK